MWEPNANNSTRNRSNRGVFLLITVLSLCILVYKAWGPILLITCALIIVVHTCYSLLVNDSLLAPQSLVLLQFTKDLGLELVQTVKVLVWLSFRSLIEIFEYLKEQYEERYKTFQGNISQSKVTAEEDMNNRHRNVYRLSTQSSDLGEQISPFSNDLYNSFTLNGGCNVGRTSTPILKGTSWKKSTVQQNGDLGLFIPISTGPIKKITPQRNENRQPSLTMPRTEETLYSPKNSAWSSSISPKIRDKGSGIKTVQTIAGPLLTSTRYNIDPKLYTDISSPGLTSRLTKYAAEANNKLTHQPQYAVGQFPKVNLNASPTPLLSPKVARARMPVTVRVAPPEIINYSLLDNQTVQERHKIYSNSPALEAKESQSCSNVAQVLKTISLKRHASIEDKILGLSKKQRTERIFEGQLENLEEMMQKRARDETISSEEDLSPQSKVVRPSKRPKASSCHDILNSLSSSLNVYTGVKRKAMDSSRCNSPDMEKHFKPSSKSPSKSLSQIQISSIEIVKSKEDLNVKIPITKNCGEPHENRGKNNILIQEINQSLVKNQQSSSQNALNITPKIHKSISVPIKVTKLTEKLFMRAEPQNNENLKNLIEEQGNVEAKFTTDDKDEIKKQDIVNMRQNSMRLRLQSMFNAISGKSNNKIDPDVVIQAEEIRPKNSITYTSLNSLTSTTNVNTSPITTTIVPILKNDPELKSPNTKHVTFNLPSTSSSFSSTSSTISTKEDAKPVEINLQPNAPSKFGGFCTNKNIASSFSFGNNIAISSAINSSKSTSNDSSAFTTVTAISNNATSEVKSTSISTNISNISDISKSTIKSCTTNLAVSSSELLGNQTKVAVSATTTSLAPITFTAVTIPVVITNTEAKIGSSSPIFGNPLVKSATSTSIAQSNTTVVTSSNLPVMTTTLAPIFSFGSTNNTSNSIFSFGEATTNTVASITPGNSAFGTTTSNNTFGTTTSSNTVGTSMSSSTFGTTATSSAFGPIASINSFGTTTSILSNTSPTSSNSAFGTAAPTVSNNANSTSFASPTVSSVMSSPTITTSNITFGSSAPSFFNTSTNSSNLFTSSSASISAPSSMFKSPATTALVTINSGSIFGAATSSPSFGSTMVTTTSVTPSLFGSNAPNNSITTSKIPSLFGNIVTSTTSTTAQSMSAFGGSAIQQQQISQNSIFSSTNITSAPTSTPIFGSTAVATAPSGLFSTGTNISQTSNSVSAKDSANSTSIFGQSKLPATISFGTNNPTFGSSNAGSTFAVGANSTTGGISLPNFNVIKPGAHFGETTSNIQSLSAAPGASIFGSTTSTFGTSTNNPTSTTFGTSPSSVSFGMQSNTNTTSPTFGASNTSSFGSPATGSPFGVPTTNSVPTIFGNTPPTVVAASNTASFSFGGQQGQQQSQIQQQPSASFSFGSSTNTTAAGNTGLFQFSGANAVKPAGFNFSAPPSAPTINFTGSAQGTVPAFNAPPTNMFSIGSGSSTPRTRPSRARRQR